MILFASDELIRKVVVLIKLKNKYMLNFKFYLL